MMRTTEELMRWMAGGIRVFAVVAIAWLTTPATRAQEGSTVHPVRKAPVEALTVNPGFRDWSPTAVAGSTIVGGNQTGKGGLVAVDARTGKVKWTYRPVFKSGTASLSTPPAIAGDLVIASFAAANPGMVAAVSLTTGKEVWRGPDPAVDAAVAVDGPLAYVLGKDGGVHAMDLATATPETIAGAIATALDEGASAADVERDGAARAARLIAQLL